jgi:N-hydroxyarylamine O-acetyltransferase
LDTHAYLRRINYAGSIEPSLKTLRELQLAHLLSVPFENLSIHIGEPIVLDDEALFNKIVHRRRGGFCYELNGLFSRLLRILGFEVTQLSASVANAQGEWGPEFDHMTLRVMLDEPWLVDVGFGDSFIAPLQLDKSTEQMQRTRNYRVEEAGDNFMLWQKEQNDEWKPQYRFKLEPHVYSDYAPMCKYHQTSPESHFTQRRICSRLTPDGRVTLSERRLIITRGIEREERELTDTEVIDGLRDYFGIVL